MQPTDTTPSDCSPRDIEPDGRCDDPESQYDTPFKLGDVVVDRDACETVTADGETVYDADGTAAAIVVQEGRARAHDVFIDGDTTVADVASNADYPADAPLVSVVFVGALDRMVDDWRDRWEPHQLDWRLDEYKDQFREEWGVPVRIKTYDYPAPRLVHAADAGLDAAAILAADATDEAGDGSE